VLVAFDNNQSLELLGRQACSLWLKDLVSHAEDSLDWCRYDAGTDNTLLTALATWGYSLT